MKSRLLFFLSLVILVTLILAACGAKSDGTTSSGTHKAGDAVEVKDKSLIITMESGGVVNSKVTATFTIENKGSSDFAIDPATSFVVSATNGEEKVTEELDKVNCGSKLIKGPVPAGGKVTGDLCWRSDPTLTWPSEAVISFGGAATDPGAVEWKVVPEG